MKKIILALAGVALVAQALVGCGTAPNVALKVNGASGVQAQSLAGYDQLLQSMNKLCELNFAKFDKNGDDVLTLAEYVKNQDPGVAQIFKNMLPLQDANHDGNLSRGEYLNQEVISQRTKTQYKNIEQAYKGHDKNHDGLLNGSELSSLFAPTFDECQHTSASGVSLDDFIYAFAWHYNRGYNVGDLHIASIH